MKIKSLAIKNIGIIKDSTLKLDNPLTIIYGDIKQGKTTYLNCIRWAFGGSFPKDILTHGEEEGFIEVELENGLINRSFYINKNMETVARDSKIILNNRPAKVNDLKRYLNPFLLNQNYLVDMKDSERNKFIVELFQIDTDGLDSELIRKETEAQNLRSKIKMYGDVRPEPVEKPDYESLLKDKERIENEMQKYRKAVDAENAELKASYESKKTKLLNEIVEFNKVQNSAEQLIEDSKTKLNTIHLSIKGTIFEKCFDIEGAKRLLKTLPEPQDLKPLLVDLPEPLYVAVDESGLVEINNKIKFLEIQKIKYDQYLKDVAKEGEKMKLTGDLKKTEEQIRIIRREKAAKQESINGIIEGLEYKNFQLWYEGTSFEMLSTSQAMSLSSKLSALYTESFGLELIDRGESLGKSVLSLVEKAEKEEKNILVTVVGEKPADVPENIGVFVVENGEIK
jgi:DNA repair ATPase RecN